MTINITTRSIRIESYYVECLNAAFSICIAMLSVIIIYVIRLSAMLPSPYMSLPPLPFLNVHYCISSLSLSVSYFFLFCAYVFLNRFLYRIFLFTCTSLCLFIYITFNLHLSVFLSLFVVLHACL